MLICNVRLFFKRALYGTNVASCSTNDYSERNFSNLNKVKRILSGRCILEGLH
jgi:hypothetical protein